MSEREHRLDGMVRLGQGRTAEIFAWRDGRVLRLYREGTSRVVAQWELRVARCVHESGIPSPAIYPADGGDGLIDLNGRCGFAMERIDGPSMLDSLTSRPWAMLRQALRFAGVHRQVHQAAVTGLPSQREQFLAMVDRIVEDVGADVVARVRTRIERLWEGNAVCHGDFHPDNVMLAARGPVVIDWGPATWGCRAADVARTVYLLRHGTPPEGIGPIGRLLIAGFGKRFQILYLRSYLRGSSVTRRDVMDWMPVICALRLAEGISQERARLRRVVLRAFGRSRRMGG